MSDVEAVLFDLDGTVWEYRRPGSEILAAAFEEAGLEPCFTVREYVDRIDAVRAGAADEAEIRRRAFASLAEERGYGPEAGRAVAEVYTRERDYRDVRALPGAREALEALASEYRIAAVTNGPREAQEPKLNELGLAGTFERVVYAGEETPHKPDPEPFEVALDHIDAAAVRTVHVGNSAVHDVAGAAAAGLRSVWIPREGDEAADGHEPDYRLGSIGDLRAPPWA